MKAAVLERACVFWGWFVCLFVLLAGLGFFCCSPQLLQLICLYLPCTILKLCEMYFSVLYVVIERGICVSPAA